MVDPEEYQHRVATAVMQAIFDASKVEDEGEAVAYVISSEAISALVDAMASILVGAPGCETPRAMRELSDSVGRKLLVRMRQMRKMMNETGQRPFDAQYIQMN